MTSISTIGLGSTFLAAQRPCLSRLGDMRLEPGALEFFDHKPPPRGRLHREARLVDVKALEPLTKRETCRRADHPTLFLTAIEINDIERDLTTMKIQPSYHRHRDLL
jgi:hypothetical protein